MKRVCQMVGAALCVVWLGGSAPAQEAGVALDESEILSFLETRIPGVLDTLNATRASDPEAYQRQLQQLGAQITYYHQVHERSPDYAESLLRAQFVSITSQALSRQILGMEPGPDRDARVQELTELLGEQFDLELRKPEMDIAFLESEIRRLRKRIEQQKQSRSAIVALRVRAMTEEDPDPTP